VFCHASVRLTVEDAAACIRELRRLIRSPATEYKAGHLLRSKNRQALEWFLGPAGPIHRRANAFLVDKTYFLLLEFSARVVRSAPFAADRTVHHLATDGMASVLCHASRAPSGRTQWDAFLNVLNELMRSGRVPDAGSVESLFGLAGALRTNREPAEARHLIDLIGRSRSCLDAVFCSDSGRESAMFPPLDPLVPAILRAVDYWTGDGRPVSIVHDRHIALTESRIAQIKELRGGPASTNAARPGAGRLSAMRLVDSGSDTRVQVADFLAGVARRLASDELARSGDPELTALLRPYVDAGSLWGDDKSWCRIGRPP
jgi:hypothetical protein